MPLNNMGDNLNIKYRNTYSLFKCGQYINMMPYFYISRNYLALEGSLKTSHHLKNTKENKPKYFVFSA